MSTGRQEGESVCVRARERARAHGPAQVCAWARPSVRMGPPKCAHGPAQVCARVDMRMRECEFVRESWGIGMPMLHAYAIQHAQSIA
eukprot:1988241-Pleurochrysis_carterae.AAC.1